MRNQFSDEGRNAVFGLSGLSGTAGNLQVSNVGLRHDTFDGYYRSPFGAVRTGTTVKLRLRTGRQNADSVSLRLYTFNPPTGTTGGPVDQPLSFNETRNENGEIYDIWAIDLVMPSIPSVLYYKFRVSKGGDTRWYSDFYTDDNDNLNQGGEGTASNNEPFPSFQITVYDPNFTTPDWIHNASVYQIFPDRFRNGDRSNDYGRPGSQTGAPVFYGSQSVLPHLVWNDPICDPRQAAPCLNTYSNQFYGGDLKGIEEKLDYLRGIGFDTIYMNPVFKARSNHRYDADNYLEIDPALGGDTAFASLVKSARDLGMKLILDAVYNHASSDSVYFDRYHRYGPQNGACEDVLSPYRRWFVFFNNVTPCRTGDYSGWFGFDSLPEFVDGSPEVRNFFYRDPSNNVTKYWYDRGASGWRFDVAPDISHDFWHDFRPFAKTYNPDGPLIGEIFPDASQYLAGDQFDGVMNYRFRKNVLGFARGGADWGDNDNNGFNRIVPLTPSGLDRAMLSIREDYPLPAQMSMLNLIDSHDTNRALYVVTLLGDDGLRQAKERLRLAALIQFTWLGAPMVYYGDEAAINAPSVASGPNGPEDDPDNRAPYPWADEAGDQNAYGPADRSMILYYSRLSAIRRRHPALRTGDITSLLTGDATPSSNDDNTYAFSRVLGSDRVIVAVNNGATANTAVIPTENLFANKTILRDELKGTSYQVSNGAVNVTLAPRGGVILSQRRR